MIINSVLFNDEYELLQFRLQFYHNVIDRVIILSSDVTFSGQPKQKFDSNFSSNGVPFEVIQLNKRELKSIDYEKRWPVEFASRQQLNDQVASKYPNATIIHSDADEFPSLEQLVHLRNLRDFTFGNIPLKTHYRRGNWSSLGTNKVCSAVSCFRSEVWLNGDLRRTHGRYVSGAQISGEVGSHFSYLKMDSREVASKLAAFSHSEFDHGSSIFNTVIPLSDHYVIDHLGRARESTFGLLKIEKLHEFNAVQIAALEFNPNWFDLHPPRRNILSRVAASVYITRIVGNPILKMQFSNSLLVQFYTVLIFFAERAKRKFRKLVNGKNKYEN